MKKALLVIDYVYSFIFPKEYQKINYKTDKIKKLYVNIQKLVDFCRNSNIEIIWIIPVISSKNSLPSNLKEIINKRIVKGVKIPPNRVYKLNPLKTDKVFEKTYYSAFSGTEGRLNNYLKSKNINTLLISGIYSTTCVDATITEAFGKGFFLEIYKNCIETIESEFSQTFQRNLLVHWKHKYGQIKEI